MKNILLLHGFKRNGEDDFKDLHEYFSSENVYNELYFDNYDLNTLNIKYFDAKVNEIANKLNLEKLNDLIIIGYSNGALLAPLIKEKLNFDDVKIFAIVPPVKIKFAKWLVEPLRNISKAKKIEKRIGKERYEVVKQKQIDSRNMEKYPIRIILFINKVRLKYRKRLLKEKDVKFLVSTTDEFIKTKSLVKLLNRNKQRMTAIDFSHAEILKKDKQIFIDWYEGGFYE